jgi:hypothetical protein
MKHLLTGLLIFLSSFAFSQGAWDRWVTTTGTNTYLASIAVPTFPSSYNNTVLRLKFPNGNTGASTINVNGVGAIPIRKWDGDSWEPLVSGDIPANSNAILYYDNTNAYYTAIIFESIGGSGSTPTLQQVLTAGSVLTGNNAITGPFGISIEAGESVAGVRGLDMTANQFRIYSDTLDLTNGARGFLHDPDKTLIVFDSESIQLDNTDGITLTTSSASGIKGATVQLSASAAATLNTRQMVGEYIASRQFKESVRVASTANIADLNNAGSSIDGVTLTATNRVLLKDQSTPSQNGIYIVSSTGPVVLSRANDFASSTFGGLYTNTLVFVNEGTAGSGKAYRLSTTGAITIGSTSLTFTEFGVGGGAVSSVFTRTGAVTAQSGDYTVAQVTGAAPLASPALTGTPTAPTASSGDNSTKIATTAYVDALTVLTTGSIIVGAGGVSTPFAIGSANQMLGVNTGGTTVEYKTIDNGLTAGSGTLKWGGALTAATSITGAFDLTYSNARYSKTSTFTTTASGQIMNTYTGTITTRATTSDDVISTRFSPTISMGAASQTATAFSLTPTLNTNNLIASTFTGFDYNPTITVGSGSLGTHYAFRATSGNVVIGSTTGLSGDRLSVYGVANNLIARFLNSAGSNRFLFNDNGSTLFVTGATSSSLDVHTLSPNFTAASGSPINKAVVISPTINHTGSATGTIFGIHYNPTLTSVTGLTHYGVVVAPTAALNGFGTAAPTATVHVVGSTKLQGSVLNSTGLQHERITTGSIGAGSTALVTVTWDVAFPDTNYTVMASVEDATTSSLSLSVVHVESKSTTDATVRVINNAVGSITGTLHIMAIHD